MNLRLWISDRVTLYGLRFADDAAERCWREALELSIDLNTLGGVLLKKQAEPAATLLPDCLSGYSFLFGMETNLEHAREIHVEPLVGDLLSKQFATSRVEARR